MSAPVQLDLVWWKDVDTTASDFQLLGEFFIFILSPEKNILILNAICLSAKSLRYSVDCDIRQRMANKNKCTDI